MLTMAKALDQYCLTGWLALDLNLDYWTAYMPMKLVIAGTVMMLASAANHVRIYHSIFNICSCQSTNIYFSEVSCEDGDLRLVGGNSAHEGQVEVCLTQRWGTVHDDEWTIADAQVVCRQLGYDTIGI